MRNMQAFSDVVVLAIKAALAPVEARLAATEQRNSDLQARVDELLGLRDRLTSVETKAALPPVVLPQGPTEAEIQILVRNQLEPVTKQLDGLSARVGVVEARPEPVAAPPMAVATGPTAAELELSLRDRLEPLTKQIAGLSERVAVIEVRAPVPGPAGSNGEDGLNGKDGADGLGFDDMDVEYDGDRTVLLKFSRGERTKSWPLVFPFQKYQGVYQQGKTYDVGDTVTWASQLWHCHEATVTPPGDGSKCWQLCVRKGRDGRDGKDAVTTPVVSVGAGRS